MAEAAVQVHNGGAHNPNEDAWRLIQGCEERLQKFDDFACMDIGSFPDNICQRLTKKEKDKRKEKAKKHEHENIGKAQAAATVGEGQQRRNGPGSFPQRQLNTAGRLTIEAGGAICSTCAMAAAHLLTGGMRDPNMTRPRVEVVSKRLPESRSGHVYVIVGRERDSNLNNSDTWGEFCYIVDTWLTTLGENFTHFRSTENPIYGAQGAFFGLPPDNQLYDSWLAEEDLDDELIHQDIQGEFLERIHAREEQDEVENQFLAMLT